MTTPNLDALAKLAPFGFDNITRLRSSDVFDALNEWAELRATLELVAGSLLAAQSKRIDAPCSADAHIDEAVRAVVQFGPQDGMFGERAKAMRAELWDSQVVAENAELRAYRERTEAALRSVCANIQADKAEHEFRSPAERSLAIVTGAMLLAGLWREPGQGAT